MESLDRKIIEWINPQATSPMNRLPLKENWKLSRMVRISKLFETLVEPRFMPTELI